jgi:hypothetical protein
MTMTTRRQFIAGGILCTVGFMSRAATRTAQNGNAQKLNPGKMRAMTLQPEEVEVLNILGEALVPGSTAAGLARYMDFQLSGTHSESLLMIKYLNVQESYSAFYRAGLSATSRGSLGLFGKRIQNLGTADTRTLVKAVASGGMKDWKGPPSPLFYFALRSDAVDVTYGTMTGFDRLHVPYMAHIQPPPTPWDV